jgi:Co/Zn/Cd efflux system component
MEQVALLQGSLEAPIFEGSDTCCKDFAMHSHSIDQWTHDHVFLGSSHQRHERRTWLVVALTAVMMGGEIAVSWFSGSMALLTDGWHMATHAVALGIAALAHLFARRQAGNSRFTFGTGKFGDLAAFSSAIILAMIAVQVAYEPNPVGPPGLHRAGG